MTGRERVLDAIAHRQADYVPYAIPIDPVVVDRLNDHYGDTAWRSRIQPFIMGTGVQWGREELPDGTWRDKFGVVWRDSDGPGAWHSVDVPLKEPTLDGYEFPELLPDEELAAMRESLARRDDLYRHMGIGMTFFERAWALRGMSEILMDFLLYPKFAHDLFERLMQLHLDILDKISDLPLDGIRFGDDFGQQRGLIMGVPVWREFLKPRLKRMYDRVHEMGMQVWIHSCGDNSPVLEDLIEIGVDVYNPFQPEAHDVYALKRDFGDRITFEGGIGTQELLPRGTPESIRAEIKRLCSEIGRGGGFILQPTKPIMPDVPTANAVACVEAILEQAGH